ncbi:MAG: hypothetical protein AB1801_14515 [Chloroflexota bacterium]
MKILGLGILWLVIFLAAFVVPRFIEPTGSGFTRGMNRLPLLFGLHCFGFILALFTAGLTYSSRAKIAKWLLGVGFAPITIDVLLIVLLVLFYVGTIISGMVSRQLY